jgi:hypothetical protein
MRAPTDSSGPKLRQNGARRDRSLECTKGHEAKDDPVFRILGNQWHVGGFCKAGWMFSFEWLERRPAARALGSAVYL